MADPQNQMLPPPPPAPVQPAAGNQDQQQQQQQQQVVPPVTLVNQQANNVPIILSQVVQVQVIQDADGGKAIKVQQTKFPEFSGQKDKDSNSANEFVKRVDKMMSANIWSDKVALENFALALRGSANTWLDSQITLKKIFNECECWMIIRPFFKEEFATESDDKLILDGFAHLAMHSSENIRDFFGHLNQVNSITLDTYNTSCLQNQHRMPTAKSAWLQCELTTWLEMNTLENSTSSINSMLLFPWIYGQSSTCNRCKPWIWTLPSDWP